MKYQFALSLAFYICGCFYMIFGATIVNANERSRINRLFMFMMSSLAIWSFSYAISIAVPTAEASSFWRSFSVFGWGVISSCLLHFAMLLTGTVSRFSRRTTLVLLYLPSAVNVVLFGPLGLLADKQYVVVPSEFGWVNANTTHVGAAYLNLNCIIYSIATLVLLISWWTKFKPRSPEKKEAGFSWPL